MDLKAYRVNETGTDSIQWALDEGAAATQGQPKPRFGSTASFGVNGHSRADLTFSTTGAGNFTSVLNDLNTIAGAPLELRVKTWGGAGSPRGEQLDREKNFVQHYRDGIYGSITQPGAGSASAEFEVKLRIEQSRRDRKGEACSVDISLTPFEDYFDSSGVPIHYKSDLFDGSISSGGRVIATGLGSFRLDTRVGDTLTLKLRASCGAENEDQFSGARVYAEIAPDFDQVALSSSANDIVFGYGLTDDSVSVTHANASLYWSYDEVLDPSDPVAFVWNDIPTWSTRQWVMAKRADVFRKHPPGAKYLFGKIDSGLGSAFYDGNVKESDETDNVAMISFSPPDPSLFVIERANGEPFETVVRNNEMFSVGSGSIFIGRRDGISRMLRVDGDVAFNEAQLIVNGCVYSTIGFKTGESSFSPLERPLFNGTFTIDTWSGESTLFTESSDVLQNAYKPGGLDIEFDGVSINANSLSFSSTIRLPNDLGLPNILLRLNGIDGLIITKEAVQLGASSKVSLPSFENVNLFNFFPVKKFSDFSIEYSAPQDLFKMQGKLSLEFAVKSGADDSGVVVTADFAGDNYLQIRGGKADAKGELSVTGIHLAKGWELEEVKLAVDTANRDITGTGRLKFPFAKGTAEVTGAIGFKLPIPPLALNSLAVDVENLNVPLPIPSFPGLMLKGFRGSLNHCAMSDPAPVEYGGGISLTLGPKITVPSVRVDDLNIDFAGGDFAALAVDLDGSVTHEQANGRFVATLVHEKIMRAAGEAVVRWAEPGFIEFNGTTCLLDGWIKTSKSFKVDSSLNVDMSDTVDFSIPASVPLFGGTKVGSGVFQMQYTNDRNFANDFVAAWKTYHIQNLGFEADLYGGIKVSFDGKVELIGSRKIPVTGSWDLATGTEWVLLSADWENAAGDVPVRVKKPDGTWINEADFSANNVAIVREMSDENTKVVLLKQPVAGHWDLAVANPIGLGPISYTAVTRAIQPAIDFPAPVATITGPQGCDVGVRYACFDPDSNARIKFFFDYDRTGFDGIPISGELTETDGEGMFTWNTRSTPAGEYAIYAMVMDGETPPVFKYLPTSVRITGSLSGDLVVSSVSISENLPAGSLVGTISIAPVAPGSVTYSLVEGAGSAGNKKFVVGGNQLRTAETFDYEDGTSESIRIRATDANGAFTEKSFEIRVTDVFDAWVVDDYPGDIMLDDEVRRGNMQLIKRGAGTLILGQANSHSGGTIIHEGQLIVQNVDALGTGMLVIKAGATVTIDCGTETVWLAGIGIREGGVLDVGRGKVSLPAGSFDLAVVRNHLANGDANAQGAGIAKIFSTAANNSGLGVGYVNDDNDGLIIGFAARGDANMDGVVDSNDLRGMVESGKYDSGASAEWFEGDFNHDGVLDLADLLDMVSGGFYDQDSYLLVTPPMLEPQSLAITVTALTPSRSVKVAGYAVKDQETADSQSLDLDPAVAAFAALLNDTTPTANDSATRKKFVGPI